MKVLEIFGEPISSGGQEVFVLNLIKYINKTDLEIDLFTPYYCNNILMKDFVCQMGGNVYSMGLNFNPGGLRFNIIKSMFSFLRDHHYDVVHIHSGSLSIFLVTSLCAKLVGIKKIIVHSHNGAGVNSFKSKLMKFVSYPIMFTCPTIYCACSDVASIAKFPQNVDVNIVKNGIDLELFNFSDEKRVLYRSKIGVDDESILLGHVGRFSYQKNHVFMIRILEGVIRRGEKCKLVFIGDGELRDEIECIVNENELGDYVYFAGLTSDVPGYLSAMDCFILPSHWEGLPYVGVEAQAVGLPVLVSDQVSRELGLSESVKFLSLDAVNSWVDAILDVKFKRYPRAVELLRNSGYDVKNTANVVRSLYFS